MIARRAVVGGMVTALLAGACAPTPMIVSRSLDGLPVPAGRMAYLPVILSPTVQDPSAAETFSRALLRRLQQAGLEMRYDDLGGQLRPRVASTQTAMRSVDQPGIAATQSAPASGPAGQLTLRQSYEQWQADGFRTVVQPVVRRYGRYPRYVPVGAPGGDQAYWTNSVDMGWYGGWGEGPGRGWESDWGGMWSEDREPGPWSTEYGTLPRTYRTLTPSTAGGDLALESIVSLGFQFFDVRTRRHIHVILASSRSFRYKPSQLEGGFGKPLARAFRLAMERP